MRQGSVVPVDDIHAGLARPVRQVRRHSILYRLIPQRSLRALAVLRQDPSALQYYVDTAVGA
jgi:hypothetical protein